MAENILGIALVGSFVLAALLWLTQGVAPRKPRRELDNTDLHNLINLTLEHCPRIEVPAGYRVKTRLFNTPYHGTMVLCADAWLIDYRPMAPQLKPPMLTKFVTIDVARFMFSARTDRESFIDGVYKLHAALRELLPWEDVEEVSQPHGTKPVGAPAAS